MGLSSNSTPTAVLSVISMISNYQLVNSCRTKCIGYLVQQYAYSSTSYLPEPRTTTTRDVPSTLRVRVLLNHTWYLVPVKYVVLVCSRPRVYDHACELTT